MRASLGMGPGKGGCLSRSLDRTSRCRRALSCGCSDKMLVSSIDKNSEAQTGEQGTGAATMSPRWAFEAVVGWQVVLVQLPEGGRAEETHWSAPGP